MNKLTKQSHLLHSLLGQFRNDIIQEIGNSISKKFDVPIEEAMDKCSVFITGLFVHILHLLIIEKMEDGEKLGKKFLSNIGKSDNDIKEIHKTYGDLKTTTKNKFKEILEVYLDVPTEDTLSDFYYLKIDSACDSIIETVYKNTDKIDLNDGLFDYTEEAKAHQSISEIKDIADGLKNTERVCLFCKTKGFFFNEFQFKGKDNNGFLYFECPKCKRDMQYDTLNGIIKTQKGILGFLFGKFS